MISLQNEKKNLRILAKNREKYLEKYGIDLEMYFEGFNTNAFEAYDEFIKQSSLLKREPETIPQDIKLLMVFGLGDGRYVREVIETSSWVNDIIIYEPDEKIFLYVCCTEDISDIFADERIEIVIGKNDMQEDLSDSVRRIANMLNITHMYMCTAPGYSRQFKEGYENFIPVIKDLCLSQAVIASTEIKHMRSMYKNDLYALSLLNKSMLASQLFEQIGNVQLPIVLVGAGPSLEKNAHFLNDLNGKAMIIACTRATETLERYGVQPDLVAMVDMEEGHDYTQHDIHREYRMLFSPNAASDIQKLYEGKGIYFGFPPEFCTISSLTKDIINFQTGGSVVTAVFSMLVAAGLKRFILVGEDLAYSDEGKTHSGHFTDSLKKTKDYFTQGIYGGMVRTRYDWVTFREFFEEIIKDNPEIEVIDATEGGALIRGSKVCALKEVVEEIGDNRYPIQEWINGMQKAGIDDIEEIAAFYKDYEDRCARAQLMFGDAISMNQALQDKCRRNETYDSAFNRFSIEYDKLYHSITGGSDTEPLRGYCSDVLFDYSERAQFLNGDEDVLERLKAEEELFKGMRAAGSELRSYIADLRKEMLN